MDITSIAVIGAGTMGAQIARVLIAHNYYVRLHDVAGEQLVRACAEIEHGRYGLSRAVERGKLTEDAARASLARLTATIDLQEACTDVDLVIEAVPEDYGIKIALFRQLDALASDRAILTSNSGGLSISAIAYATDRPERVLTWHWSQPCVVMRMAELVIHDRTAPEAIEAVVLTARRCGKNPVVVRDQPLAWGYVANRIHFAARREAAKVVAEGIATEEQVDTLMRDCYNWPVGPFGMQQLFPRAPTD